MIVRDDFAEGLVMKDVRKEYLELGVEHPHDEIRAVVRHLLKGSVITDPQGVRHLFPRRIHCEGD